LAIQFFVVLEKEMDLEFELLVHALCAVGGVATSYVLSGSVWCLPLIDLGTVLLWGAIPYILNNIVFFMILFLMKK